MSGQQHAPAAVYPQKEPVSILKEAPPHLVPRLKKSRAIPLLPLWALVACSIVNFTFLPLPLPRIWLTVTTSMSFLIYHSKYFYCFTSHTTLYKHEHKNLASKTTGISHFCTTAIQLHSQRRRMVWEAASALNLHVITVIKARDTRRLFGSYGRSL